MSLHSPNEVRTPGQQGSTMNPHIRPLPPALKGAPPLIETVFPSGLRFGNHRVLLTTMMGRICGLILTRVLVLNPASMYVCSPNKCESSPTRIESCRHVKTNSCCSATLVSISVQASWAQSTRAIRSFGIRNLNHRLALLARPCCPSPIGRGRAALVSNERFQTYPLVWDEKELMHTPEGPRWNLHGQTSLALVAMVAASLEINSKK